MGDNLRSLTEDLRSLTQPILSHPTTSRPHAGGPPTRQPPHEPSTLSCLHHCLGVDWHRFMWVISAAGANSGVTPARHPQTVRVKPDRLSYLMLVLFVAVAAEVWSNRSN